jgi:glycine/D-amino acid oxidase-like deaminating enzyme
MGSDPHSETYWRPIHVDHVLVGGNPTAAEAPRDAKRGVSDAFLDRVRRRIPSLLPALRDATVVKGECCPTPDAATPDAMPIVDAPDDVPDGIVVATGFQRGGVLTSPCTRAIVRSLVTGEPSEIPHEPFALSRFDSRTSDFDPPSIYGTFE